MKYDIDFYKTLGINTEGKAFKRYYKAGLLDEVDHEFIKDIKSYWKKWYGKEIDPLLHIAFSNLTGKKDVRVVPSKPQMWNEFIPFFNDMNIRVGYSDKNIYDKLVHTDNRAETILKRVRGHYFDSNNNALNNAEVEQILSNIKEDIIIKPSNADNGIGVSKLKYVNGELYLKDEAVTLDKLHDVFGYNYIVQKIVEQHEIMARPHPSSVNTLRMVTLRWNNEIHHLLTYARIGVNNDVRDNSAAGGICVGVNDKGQFYDFAINKHLHVLKKHPSTGFDFSEMGEIPNYSVFVDFVKDLHTQILHHDFVSWDIIVGKNLEPVFLELNFRGPTWIYQLASQKPMFGDLTEQILPYVSKELSNKQNRNSQSALSKLQRKHTKLKKEHNKLKKANKELLENHKKVKSELQYIKSSKSWKITKPLRKIKKKI